MRCRPKQGIVGNFLSAGQKMFGLDIDFRQDSTGA
jgi:hypothetical protein